MDRHIEALLANADWVHVNSESLEVWNWQRLAPKDGEEKVFSEPGLAEKLTSENELMGWLRRKSPENKAFEPPSKVGCELVGGFCLLFKRQRLRYDNEKSSKTEPVPPPPLAKLRTSEHQDQRSLKSRSSLVLPWATKSIFESVSRVMRFPRTYVPALNHPSGIVHSTTFKGSDGRNLIGFVAQNINYRWESWSLSLTYDPVTNITTGVFCADTETDDPDKKVFDMDKIIADLKHQKSPSLHPMHLPTIMLRQLQESSVDHYRMLREEITDLEQDLQEAKCSEDGLDDCDREHHDWSRRLNYCKNQQASRDGRRQFSNQFLRVLNMTMEKIESQSREGLLKKLMESADRDLREWISFTASEIEIFEGRDVNHSGRIDAQLKRLYNLITQNESRSQVYIARKMSKDSSEMASLTWLGAFFLPSNNVGTLLGIQSYNLSKEIFKWYVIWTLPLVLMMVCVFPFQLVRRVRSWIQHTDATVTKTGSVSSEDTSPKRWKAFVMVCIFPFQLLCGTRSWSQSANATVTNSGSISSKDIDPTEWKQRRGMSFNMGFQSSFPRSKYSNQSVNPFDDMI